VVAQAAASAAKVVEVQLVTQHKLQIEGIL
jgi:hypothetical protein